MSPERICGAKYTCKADIWSLGLIVLECLLGDFPYDMQGAVGAFDLCDTILTAPVPSLLFSSSCLIVCVSVCVPVLHSVCRSGRGYCTPTWVLVGPPVRLPIVCVCACVRACVRVLRVCVCVLLRLNTHFRTCTCKKCITT